MIKNAVKALSITDYEIISEAKVFSDISLF